jgi:hypothetical protein
MTRFLTILILTAGLPLLAEDPPAQKPPPPKEVVKPPAQTAAKPAPQAPPVSPRARHPFGRPAPPTAAKTEYAKPSVDPSSRRPPVVWEKSWASPVTVEWEDAPVRVPAAVQPTDGPSNVAEDITAIRKQLEELTQMVRALGAAQQAHQ